MIRSEWDCTLEPTGAQPAVRLWSVPDGSRVHVAGLVTHRQRPENAKGATFVTLEDETGYVNGVIWKDLGVRQRKNLLGASLMGIACTIQREGDVIHLVVRNLLDYTPLLGKLVTESRDVR